MPISNLDAMRSVFNHRLCLNSAANWSRCIKIPTFSSMGLKSLSKYLCLKQFYTF